MAVTNETSDLMTGIVASPPVLNLRNKSKAQVHLERFAFTQGAAAGDANSTIRVCRVPAGADVCLELSHIRWSAFGAARLLAFGYEAHTRPDGTAVTAALTAFFTALDVAAAGRQVLSAAGTNALDNRVMEGEAVLALQCTGGTIPAGATVRGVIAWVPG